MKKIKLKKYSLKFSSVRLSAMSLLLLLIGFLLANSAGASASESISDSYHKSIRVTQAEQSNQTADIINKFTSKIKSVPAFEMEFNMVVNGSSFDGLVQAQGEFFKLTTSQVVLYCNGITKWIHNIDNKELTIIPNDPSITDLTENPLAFLTSLEKGYRYNQKAVTANVGSKSVWLIELKPVNKNLPYTSITLGIEKNSLIPVSVEYLSKDGMKHTAKITSFTQKNRWPETFFIFPTSAIKGLNITDLR